jgi:hypothetical protein
MCRADNLTIFMCRLFLNLGAIISWNRTLRANFMKFGMSSLQEVVEEERSS